MSDKQTVVGTLAGITEKPSGWTTIEVDLPGKSYPLKLDTKLQPLIELARAAGTEQMEWSYKEQDSGTPNPNRPGSNFLNRYFEGVAPVSGNASKPSPGDSGLSKDEWRLKDRAADKRACIAIAAAQVTALWDKLPEPEPLGTLDQICERTLWLAQRYFENVQRQRAELPFDAPEDPTDVG